MTSPGPALPAPGEDPSTVLPAGLVAHWRSWLGASAEQLDLLGRATGPHPRTHIVGSPGRTTPGWDGEVHPVVGVVDPHGNAVVSLPPAHVGPARELVSHGRDLAELRAALPDLVGQPHGAVYQGVYRWGTERVPTDRLPAAGEWLPVEDPRVPAWLRPFGGRVLIALADTAHDGLSAYRAGVGLKRHDEHVHEISVGTAEYARGKGLARRLVAQAARHLITQRIVPTYLHDPANEASARVADAAGFPDRGWTVLGLFVPDGHPPAAKQAPPPAHHH